jgi:amidohydrolase
MILPDLAELAAAHGHELVALRRILHSQPELSGVEHVTTEMLVERLIVEGLEPTVLASGTGLVCDISLDPAVRPDAASMPTVALRADIDALAMDDLTDTPYRSRHAGVAHACGHDVHTAALLGAALTLLDVRRSAPRRAVVRLVFEPSEEVVPGGAVDVISEGWLDHVRCIYGVHCDPKLDVGTVGLRVGPLTAAADRFEVQLTGPGGHTARPHLTVDLVRWTGRVADRLSGIVQRLAGADVTMVFGAVHAGAAANVIPATARLHGSFRTTDRATWLDGRRLIEAALAELISDPSIGEPPHWNLEYVPGVPPVVNDVAATQRVGRVATRLLGQGGVVDTPQSMGGDSFAWYLERVPGTYVRLGTHDPADPGERRDLHSATFDVDERAIVVGATILAGAALAALDA